MNKIATIALAVGGVAFALLVVGALMPAWLVSESEFNFPESDLNFPERILDFLGPDLLSLDVHAYENYGLYYNTMCYKIGSSTECAEVEALPLTDAFKLRLREEDHIGNAVRWLVLSAAVCCIMAMVLSIDFTQHQCFQKVRLPFIGMCWLVKAVLASMAVGLQAHENAKYEDTTNKDFNDIAAVIDISFVSYKFKTPWSMVITGVGAVLAVISSVLTAILYFRYTSSKEPVVGQWYPFQNATVDQTNHSSKVAYHGAVIEQRNHQQTMANPCFGTREPEPEFGFSLTHKCTWESHPRNSFSAIIWR